MKKGKNWFTWFKKRPNQTDTIEETNPNSRKEGKKHFSKTPFGNYFTFIKTYLKTPLPEVHPTIANNSYYGLVSLVAFSLFNTVAITSLANYFISHYEWFANISILPGLSFTFIPWLFAIQVFLYLFISFWLLPAILYFTRSKFFNDTTENTIWLTQYFGKNSISIILSFIEMLMGLFAPIIFFIVIIFLWIIQLLMFIITAAFSLFKYSNDSKLPIYYWLFILFFIYIIAEMILATLIF